MARIYPSLMSANPLFLANQIDALKPYCAGFHIDIMDGHFVPNMSWGPDIVNAMAQYTTAPLWLHLMVDFPLELLKNIEAQPGTITTIHIENKVNRDKFLQLIREKNWVPSVAVSPKTPVEELEPFLGHIGQALVMSVEPGFSGQQYMESVNSKISWLHQKRTEKKLSFRIGIDGGVTMERLPSLIAACVDDLAVASALFNTPDPVATLQQFTRIAKSARC